VLLWLGSVCWAIKSTLLCGIYWPYEWLLIVVAILEKLNHKHTKDLAQQRQNPETVGLSASSSAGRGRG